MLSSKRKLEPFFTLLAKVAKNTRIAKYLLTCRANAAKHIGVGATTKRDLRAAIESRLRLGDDDVFDGFSWRESEYHRNMGKVWHLYELLGPAKHRVLPPYSLCKREMSHRTCAVGFVVGAEDVELHELARCSHCMNAFAGRG